MTAGRELLKLKQKIREATTLSEVKAAVDAERESDDPS